MQSKKQVFDNLLIYPLFNTNEKNTFPISVHLLFTEKENCKKVSLKTYRKFNPQNFLQIYCQKYDSNPSTNHTPQFFGNFVTYSHWLGRPAPPSRADKNNGGGTKAEKDQRKVFHLVEQFPSHVR